MSKQKRHVNRVYQVVGEPGPGALAAGYTRYSSEMQDPATIVTQRRRIEEFAARKGWTIARWYEEPEQSAKYEEIDQRPVFAHLLDEAGLAFQVVLCYMNNRWARNPAVAYASLGLLRRKRVWWATSDGLWDIDKVQTDGFDVAFAVDTQMNAAYVRQLSKRTIDGKEDRARDGYHNGRVPFGYLPPEYPKAPDGAPSTWRPPRMPVRTDPVNFPALVRIGELAAQGWGDSAIADELESHFSTTPRFGVRLLTKDTVAAIRRMWFPREFTPGSGHGTIETPSGELVEGRHPSAWTYDLWQRMVEAKAGRFRRSDHAALRQSREFSRIVACAGCIRPLRVQSHPDSVYYRDTSSLRKLPCPAHGCLSVRSEKLVRQFGELLGSVQLPATWREAVAERCRGELGESSTSHHVARKRELESEQKRLVVAFTKGYLSEGDLDEQIERIRGELRTLPSPEEWSVSDFTETVIGAGETFEDMAGYWNEALPEERRDIVWALLKLNGLVYDLERQAIIALTPRDEMLPVLSIGLAPRWEQSDDGLRLATEYLPPKRRRANPHMPLPMQYKLDYSLRTQAREMIHAGMTMRQVADYFRVSRMAVWRALHADDMPER